MIRPYQLLILLVLAAASAAAAAVVLRSGTATVASDRRGERVVPGLGEKANTVTAVLIRQGSDTVSLERRGADFVAAPSGYPVKGEPVRELIAGMIELAFEEARTSDPARHGDLGLADPGKPDGAKEIVLRGASGDVADILLGHRDGTVGGPMGGVFVRLKDQPQTWLARGNVRLPSDRAEWFVPLDFAIKRDEISKIELSGGGREAVLATAVAEKPGELKLENVPEKRVADTSKLARLPGLVENFSFEDVRKRSKPADDARRMAVETRDGLRLVLTSVGEPSEGWVGVSAEVAGDAKDEKVRERAQAIAGKVEGYEFRLRSAQADVLGWTSAELTSEPRS